MRIRGSRPESFAAWTHLACCWWRVRWHKKEARGTRVFCAYCLQPVACHPNKNKITRDTEQYLKSKWREHHAGNRAAHARRPEKNRAAVLHNLKGQVKGAKKMPRARFEVSRQKRAKGLFYLALWRACGRVRKPCTISPAWKPNNANHGNWRRVPNSINQSYENQNRTENIIIMCVIKSGWKLKNTIKLKT